MKNNLLTRTIFRVAIALIKLGLRISGDVGVFSITEGAIIVKALEDKTIQVDKDLRGIKRYRGLRCLVHTAYKRVKFIDECLCNFKFSRKEDGKE